jgi:CBS domain-containing protein
VIQREVTTVPAAAPSAAVTRAVSETTQATMPVLDRDGTLAGLIIARDLLALLAGDMELVGLVNALDLSRQNPPLLTLESNLDEAAQMMEYDALDELPVVESPRSRKFVGLVARHDIARALNRVSLSVSTLAAREENIFWASGYRVSRMQAPAGAVGKSLRDLDARSRFGVSVLAVQNTTQPDAGFEPCPPDRVLRVGDRLIVAGSPAALRRFVRDLAGEPDDAPPVAKI